MKKYLKTQLKKSLSLMMAVLMVLSCWVWVAPESLEAEAADNDPGSGWYYVQVFGDYTDWTASDKLDKITENKWTVTYKENNGNGTERSTTLSYIHPVDYGNDPNIDGASLKNIVIAAGWVHGFPTKVNNSQSIGCGGDAWQTDPKELRVGYAENTSTASGTVIATSTTRYSCAVKESYNIDVFTVDPQADGIKPVPTTTTVSKVSGVSYTVNVPELGTTTVVKTDNVVTGTVKDQYGVTLQGETPEKYFVGSNDLNGTTYPNTEAHGAWMNGSTLNVNANIQKNVEEKKIYIYSQIKTSETNPVNSTDKVEVTLVYPKYNMTVYPNGGTMVMNGGTTQTANWVTKGEYDSNGDATNYPTGEATRTGFDFKGFWSEPQPGSGNAGVNAYGSEFFEPVSTVDFEKYCTQVNDTDGDRYVTVGAGENAKRYYNAGKKWDPADRKISGDNYYAWWLATDVPVDFYDIDGKYLGTHTFKYGQTGKNTNVFPDPRTEYIAGPYTYQTFANKWISVDGEIVPEGTDEYTFTRPLTLTPVYATKSYNAKNKITFVKPADGTALSSKDYDYRYVLGKDDIPTPGLTTAMSGDKQYSYAFEGWTTQVPKDKSYHLISETDTSFAVNNDWVVRENATYYPVFRTTVKKYVIAFTYYDTTGAEVTKKEVIDYGSVIPTPSYVNRAYASNGMGYTLESWYYNNFGDEFGADEFILFNDENVTIISGNLADGTNETPIEFVAKYGNGVPMPYTVSFKYKDAKGADVIKTAEVYHGNEIADSFDPTTIVVPDKYDDGKALYTYSGNWKMTEGKLEAESDTDEYATAGLAALKPQAHVTFEAIYDDGVPFYTVKYIDGAKDYSERILAGSNVPGWVVDGEEYVPAKEKNDKGTFEFAGWYDEPQKDSEYKVTNGKKYTQTDIVTGDLTLYPQFKFSAFKFDIIFWNHDKTVQLGGGQYEYGQKFDDAFYRAQKGAQTREPDETYEYEFIGWDQPYNEENLMCEGKNVEFVALYKAKYIYYDAQWYSGKKDNAGNWLVDENKLLATTKHTYNSKLYAPSADFGFLPEGYVFDGWYYKDANGTEQPYVRGMLITGDMTFYAKYRQAAITHTVTAVVGGKPTNYTVADGETAKQIADPAAGYGDEKWHSAFVGWYTDSSYQTEFDIANTPITEDIEIFARVVSASHVLSEKELVSAPTYYAAGSEKAWCSCSREKTEVTREIPMLTDTVAPTGTIYLGTLGSWSSTDEVGAAATDNDTVELYVNDKTDIVLTINDTGDVNTAYNPAGLGKGIALIQGIISTGVFGADTTEIAGIQTIFSDASQDSNNTANYVISLGEYEGLEDGKTYIAYYYVKDKAGNVLNKNVRTAKFIYDVTAPEFIIEGASNASKVGESVATYCGKAVIKGIENDATVTVNGETVTLTTAGISGTTAYTISEAGNYTITVTDKAGNSASKKIVVAEGHNEYVSKKAAACGVAGFEKVVCLVCDKVISETTIPALQHEWAEVIKAATCTAPGEKYNECKLCGETTDPEAIPQLAHTYATDDEGNIIYTVEKEANCSVKGKETAACTLCGAKLEREIATNDVHVYGPLKTIKATCTEDGMKYKTCKLCNETYTVETIEATGHVDTQWVVTTEATCGTAGIETLQCKACGVGVDSADEDDVVDTREIPATNRHILAVSTDPTKTFDATADSEGQITHYCTQCGKEWSKPIDKIVKYTVSFVGEDGTTKLAEDMVVLTGTTITAEMAPVATKDSDDQYDYTFAGWVDNATGKTVKLPYDVTADITLKATFAESTRVYVHIFKVPTTWTATTEAEGSTVVFANIMGAYDDTNKKPAAVPVFTHEDPVEDARLKKLYTFEFDYWKDIYGNKVEDFTMKGDATFTAQFKTTPVTYKVIYYNGTELVWNTTVNGGANVTFGGTLPTKDPDAENHYAFDKWYTDATLKTEFDAETQITADTRLYAGFTATEHAWEADAESAENKAATCTEAAQVAYKCSVCGEPKVETVGEKLGHTPAEAVQEEVDGVHYSVVYCSVCSAELSRNKTSVTVAFKNYNGVRLDTLTLNIGDAITEPAAPTRASDAQYDYTFAGWFVEGDKTETIVVPGNAQADIAYVAKYTATPRTFRVTYVDVNNKTLQTQDGIEYGAAVPGFNGANPTKAKDDTNHYTFATWSVAADAKVTTDLVIKPVFTAEKHTYNAGEETGGSCTEASGMKYTCTVCGHSYTDGGAPATGHNYVVTDRTEPNYETGTDGAEIYTCTKCGDSYSKEISGDMIEILVNVKDANGNPVKDARVDLYYKSNNAPTGHFDYSDADGIVRFYVVPGEYKVLITADGMKESSYDVTVNENGETQSGTAVMQPEEVDTSCKCSCHRDNFWGVIFRFFQKIIKLFTGKAACCSDPDSRI